MPRRSLITLAALLALAIAVFAAYRVAVQRLQGALAEALGPRATLGAVELGWAGLTVRDLRIAAGPGWPAGEELHARVLRVRPDLASAFGSSWRIQRIEVEDARIVLLRGRDGRLRVLPALLDERRRASPTAASAASAPVAPVLIDHVVLSRVHVDLYDASLGLARPHRVQLADLKAQIDSLAAPAFDQPMQLDVQATVKGPARDGRLTLAGTLTPATRDAQLRGELQGVDLVALQPYLLKVADGGVKRGTLDLQLQATVQGQKLKAPGRVTLTGLELGEGSGLQGLSRQAAVAALKRRDRIELGFTLEGRLDDPAFSINDSLAMRFAAGLAEALGVSLEGVVEGVGKVFKGLLGR
ncbi:MAG: DUF748 domain-containing protein [Pseudomonadota bacterium]